MTKTEVKTGALAGIRVLDLTDERGIYGVKLLADLGADVVRPEPPEGDPLRARGPTVSASSAVGTAAAAGSAAAADGGSNASLWHAYFASNRRFITLGSGSSRAEGLRALVDEADIVVTCAGAFGVAEAELDRALERRQKLVVVDVTSFGKTGPWKDFLAPDLIAGALGGAVATTGDIDTDPLKSFGELNFMVSGVYAAIAALTAWLGAQREGRGQRAEVSVHECIASCLEHVLMWHWYEHLMPSATSSVLPRRGSLHWSNAYKVMNAAKGSIMVTPAPDFEKQIFWLVEEDAQDDLIDPKYLEPENAPLMIKRVMEILHGWVAEKDAEKLFFEAQERHAPYGWVLPVEKLAENPQLDARGWWAEYNVAGVPVKGPGAPYQFADTPWRMGPQQPAQPELPAEATAEQVLTAAGWHVANEHSSRPNTKQARGTSKNARAITNKARAVSSKKARPLEGVRVLDFTHVLAGPFATRVLADMGADVIKVSSLARAQATNDPSHPYYIMWNRSKRSLALNMGDPEARPIARALALQADVVIDNFSVGVLDRWGIGYDSVSKENPGVVYTQMSGMGEGGPWSKFVTYAPTIHALCGLTQLTGVPGREDIGVGFSYNDHQAGLHGSVAILAALASRERTGRGQRVDLSQFETGVNFLGPAILDWFANKQAARPSGNDLPYDLAAPHGVYPCVVKDVPGDVWSSDRPHADVPVEAERWIAIACMSDEHWLALKTLLGSPEWCLDAALDSADGRVAARADIDAKLRQWTAAQDASDLMIRCQAAGVPAGVVQTGSDLLERDPALAAAGFALAIEDPLPDVGQTYADRLPIRFTSTPCDTYTRVRKVGEDNASVLADWLGMSAEEVAAAEKDGRLT